MLIRQQTKRYLALLDVMTKEFEMANPKLVAEILKADAGPQISFETFDDTMEYLESDNTPSPTNNAMLALENALRTPFGEVKKADVSFVMDRLAKIGWKLGRVEDDALVNHAGG